MLPGLSKLPVVNVKAQDLIQGGWKQTRKVGDLLHLEKDGINMYFKDLQNGQYQWLRSTKGSSHKSDFVHTVSEKPIKTVEVTNGKETFFSRTVPENENVAVTTIQDEFFDSTDKLLDTNTTTWHTPIITGNIGTIANPPRWNCGATVENVYKNSSTGLARYSKTTEIPVATNYGIQYHSTTERS